MSTALDLYLRTAHVVGQEKARKQMAVLLADQVQVAQDPHGQQDGAILAGRTGTGKTYLARSMASICGLPFAEVNATQYTEVGYIGLSLAQMFLPLIESASEMYDEAHQRQPYHVETLRNTPSVLKRPQKELEEIVALAQTGVVLLDEFDKWMLQDADSAGRNVGRKLQAELLKMVEGGKEYVTDSEEELGVLFDTTRVLIICAGAFVGLARQVARRLGIDMADNPNQEHEAQDTFYESIDPGDFVKYGLLPELAGRLSTHIFVRPLKDADLAVIAITNGLIDRYRKRFEMLGCEWEVDEAAVVYIAREALSSQVGARGIKYALWQTFSEALFEASVREGPKCVRFSLNSHKARIEAPTPKEVGSAAI